jgi:RNase P protein component
MAKRKGVNKSEEIRQIFKANPNLKAKEVVSMLEEKGIKATEGLVYFIKGKIVGRKRRKRRARNLVAKVAATTGNGGDALATVLKVKRLADEVGGMKKLKALVEALTA